jgi:ABC-type branched-subunit amino acid transport system ATPase component/ABC-type branched-subunit amino acid transport system permease subunit
MMVPGSWLLAILVLTWPMWRPTYLVFSANSAIPIAIAALGLLVLVGWARELSLATAGIFASAVYLDGYLNRELGGPGWPWVYAAVAVILGCGAVMALLALSSSRLPGIYLLVLTFGLQVVIERTIFTYGRFSGGLGGGDEDGNIVVNRRPQFFDLDLTNGTSHTWLGQDVTSETVFYLFSLFWLEIILAIMVRLRRSPMGLGFLLVGADRQAAAAVGMNPLRFRVYAFTISGLLAGAGGILMNWLLINPPSFVNYLSPYSLVLLAIPILAGLDSIAFILVVALGFQLVPVQLESLRISPFILAGVGLIGGAVFGSRGMGGRARDLWRHVMYGDRRTRTQRDRVDTTVLRKSEGRVDEAAVSQLSPEERAEALAILESWLPPRKETTYAVKAEGIKVIFGKIHALDDASIVVPTHKMVGLLGPNGAGKTTLFDVISGQRRPTHGKVSLFDQDVTGMNAWDRSRLGMARTFQTTRVMTDLTVADNLLAGAYQRIKAHPLLFILGVPSAWRQLREAEEAAFAAAKLLDIDRYWNERCGSLEFSARRRAEIGRCLLAGPRLLLLDEPAAGLDPASSVALFTLIKNLHEDLGLTVLLVEHYVKAVLDSCDLVYVLAEGKILAEGTPEQVANDPEVRSRYLGTRMKYTPRKRVEVEESILEATADSENGAGPKHAGQADEAELEETPAAT